MKLHSIDLRIGHRLKDPAFRREWFRAELETMVPSLFRSMREKRELNQTELATLAGMQQSAISRFEISTDAKWKFETLQKMAEALDSRLYIGLETAEDVIDRIEREEREAASPRPSAKERSADNSPNKIGSSVLDDQNRNFLAQQGRPLENPKKTMKEGDRPWN